MKKKIKKSFPLLVILSRPIRQMIANIVGFLTFAFFISIRDYRHKLALIRINDKINQQKKSKLLLLFLIPQYGNMSVCIDYLKMMNGF